MADSIGKKLVFSSCGESHSEFIGGTLDGFPSNFVVDFDKIDHELRRRRTGESFYSSSRKEEDKVEYISGFDSFATNGDRIEFKIKNNNAKKDDYNAIKNIFRPSHADYTYFKKYGTTNFSGGGRASGRETVCRVVAGALAKQFLENKNISFFSYISQIGNVAENTNYNCLNFADMEKNPLATPNSHTAKNMIEQLKDAALEGDSLGGTITCVIRGVEAGLGLPIYDKLSARLAYAMLTIPSAKGFDYGLGFEAASRRGSDTNDAFVVKNNRITTITNRNGGILGGISNGEDIYFRVAFKPVPSIFKQQKTVDIFGSETNIKIQGRHDTCIVPRVLPVVEAMAALTIMDFWLIEQ